MKNSFVVYYEIIEQLEDFTDEQVGKIFRAMVDYDRNGTIPNFTGTMKLAFKFIKQNLDINKEKYKNICERNRANGQLGGRPKNPNNPSGLQETQETQMVFEKPNETQENPEKPKKPDNDNDIDIVIDNEKKKVSKKEEKEILSNTHTHARESYDEIFETFGVSHELKNVLIEFIRHCQVNGRIVTNEKLKNIIIRLDFNCSSEVEKIHSVKRAINGGYFDIREERA